MRRGLFSILAALSLGAAAFFACGYVVEMGVVVGRGPRTAGYAQWDLDLGEGRVREFYYEGATAAGHEVHCWWRPPTPRLPDLPRATVAFDWHSVKPGWHLVGFPLWCPMLPLLILPTMWYMRRRRERADPRGFSIEDATGSRVMST